MTNNGGPKKPSPLEDLETKATLKIDVLDLATGISPRELGEIANSWNVVKNDLVNNGVEILLYFLTNFPVYVPYFKDFGDIPLGELKNTPNFKKHAKGFMYAIGAVVEHLYDLDCLRGMLLRIGIIHYRIRVTEQALQDMKTTLLQWLKRKLPAKLTPSTLSAWDRMLSIVTGVMLEGMNCEPSATALPRAPRY